MAPALLPPPKLKDGVEDVAAGEVVAPRETNEGVTSDPAAEELPAPKLGADGVGALNAGVDAVVAEVGPPKLKDGVEALAVPPRVREVLLVEAPPVPKLNAGVVATLAVDDDATNTALEVDPKPKPPELGAGAAPNDGVEAGEPPKPKPPELGAGAAPNDGVEAGEPPKLKTPELAAGAAPNEGVEAGEPPKPKPPELGAGAAPNEGVEAGEPPKLKPPELAAGVLNAEADVAPKGGVPNAPNAELELAAISQSIEHIIYYCSELIS